MKTRLAWTLLPDRGLLSREYVIPLAMPVEIANRYGTEGTATHVGRWYNRTTRDWVVIWCDADCTQIGSSAYVYSLEDAEDEAAHMLMQAAGQRVIRQYS